MKDIDLGADLGYSGVATEGRGCAVRERDLSPRLLEVRTFAL
jgi:hypothetical protein